MNEIVIEILNNRLVVSSKDVAEHFKKRHDHVLRDIEAFKIDIPNFGEMFDETSYEDNYGRNQKLYVMNRDGFTLLAMGFTGKDALEWKLKYINAFNKMEEKLKRQLPTDFISALKQLLASEEEKQLLVLENKQKEQIINELKPKADYTDTILKSKDLLTTTQIAKDYGMSGKKLNSILKELGIQYKQSEQWLLYSKYQASGYTSSETITYKDKYDKVHTKLNTKWTQKGRLFLYTSLKDKGILPTIERED